MYAKLSALLVLLMFFSVNSVWSIDFPDSRGDALGGTIILSEPSATSIVQSGVSSRLFKGVLLDIGYRREYQLAEFDNLYVACGGTIKKFNLFGGVTQFGQPDYYTEKIFRTGAGYTLAKNLHTAFIYTHRVKEFNKLYPSISDHSFSFSLSYYSRNMYFTSKIETKSEEISLDSRYYNRFGFVVYTEIISSDIYHTTAKILFEETNEKRFGLGEKIDIHANSSILFGYMSNPRLVGGGIIFHWEQKSITYTASHHPVLGLTHTISFQFELLKNQ